MSARQTGDFDRRSAPRGIVRHSNKAVAVTVAEKEISVDVVDDLTIANGCYSRVLRVKRLSNGLLRPFGRINVP